MDFQKIYIEFQPKIHHYLSRMMDPEEAEDVVQEVFEKVNRSLHGFRGQSKLSTWIYRIATNTAIDRLRSAALKHSSKQAAFEETGDAEVIDLFRRDLEILERCRPAPDSIAPGVDLFPLPGVTRGTCGLLLAMPAQTALALVPLRSILTTGLIHNRCRWKIFVDRWCWFDGGPRPARFVPAAHRLSGQSTSNMAPGA